jgi:ubiquitin-like modifier-activating enzyme ATG7
MSEDSNNSRKNIINAMGLLGGVPHTIRGSLWCHEMALTVTHRFPLCTACSVPLIKEYRQRGFDFILDACNVPNYLEKLSGLEEILNRPDLDEVCVQKDEFLVIFIPYIVYKQVLKALIDLFVLC